MTFERETLVDYISTIVRAAGVPLDRDGLRRRIEKTSIEVLRGIVDSDLIPNLLCMAHGMKVAAFERSRRAGAF